MTKHDDKHERDIEMMFNRKPRPKQKGEPGDCEFCGRWDSRLVEGVCKGCRDHWKLT